jgi:redox-sensing transcriptional repressor
MKKDRETKSIPAPAVRRLTLYLHHLEKLLGRDVHRISSQELAESLQLTSAQVRRDLAYFGQFGRRGVGYEVASLTGNLRAILTADRTWSVILVGAGDLGRALARYRGFAQRGFKLVAAFDISPQKIGKKIGSLTIRHIREMPAIVKRDNIRLALLTAPASAAQDIADQLDQAGVRGILSFAPGVLQTSEHLAVGQVDLASNLQQLAFSIASEK